MPGEYEWSESFQQRLLAMYLRDPHSTFAIVEPMYFTSPIHQDISRWAQEIYVDVKRTEDFHISRPTMLAVVKGALGKKRADVWPLYRKVLKTLYAEDLQDRQIILQQAVGFAREQKFRKALIDAEKDVNSKNYPRAIERFESLKGFGLENDLGVEYWKDPTDPNRWVEDRRDVIGTFFFPQLDDAMDGGIGEGELGIVLAGGKVGKAQPLWSKIKTPTGWKRMGDLKVGDSLASVDGKKSEVLGVFPQGRKKIYCLTFSDGRKAYCTRRHLWKVYHVNKNKDAAPFILETGWMLRRGRSHITGIQLYVPQVSGDFGNHKKLPLDPYLLGVLLGDGDCGRTPGVSTNDQEIFDRIREIVLKGKKGYDTKRRSTDPRKFDFSITRGQRGKSLGAAGCPNWYSVQLRKLGLFKKDCYSKFIPKVYLRSTKENRIALLQGLMDTDGGAGKQGATGFSSTSKQLCKDFMKLVWSLGGTCTTGMKVSRSHYTYKGKRLLGALTYSTGLCLKDRENLFRLTRKLKRVVNSKKRRTGRLLIISVELVGEEEACCIAVSHPSGLYVTDDYVVTHNTTMLARFGAGALWQGKNVAIATGELSALKYRKRIDAMVTMTPTWELAQLGHVNDEESLMMRKLRKVQSRMLMARGHMRGSLWIRQWPTGKGRVNDIENWLDQLKQQGTDIDILLVDYIRTFRPNERFEEQRLSIGQVCMDLRGLAIERSIPVWTASQTTRGALSKEFIGPEDIAEDISQFWTLDFLIALCQTKAEEERKPQRARLMLTAARDVGRGKTIEILLDRNTFRGWQRSNAGKEEETNKRKKRA